MSTDYHTFEKNCPVSLRYVQPFIKRVYARLPNISKAKVAVIIKEFFLIMRQCLAEGRKISIVGLFRNLRLTSRRQKGDKFAIHSALKTDRKFRRVIGYRPKRYRKEYKSI